MSAAKVINAIEAQSPSLFESGWRPGLGWIGVVGLGYQWLIVPLVSYAYTLWTGHALTVVPPAMDPNLLVPDRLAAQREHRRPQR